MSPSVMVQQQCPSGGGHQQGCGAGQCAPQPKRSRPLATAVQAKVATHPCYSEQAHRRYARMHVAVAPACNIQCHYCNRRYDCANESRPGVTSEVLTPQQALRKVIAVAAKIPQLSVVGIAGPGDPLANPKPTLETLRLLAEEAPHLALCLSTNGLMLSEYIDALTAYRVNHITITINAIDPLVAAQIHPWVYWQGKRIHGIRAAEILIEQQRMALQALVAKDILVKVNSVMIPGINADHLPAVARFIKAQGAFLHNIMPLIAEARYGSHFGLMGQAVPTAQEVKALREACGNDSDMRMMRHCRQCRADAVGLLGEDRSHEFTLDKIEAPQMSVADPCVSRRPLTAHPLALSRQPRAIPLELVP